MINVETSVRVIYWKSPLHVPIYVHSNKSSFLPSTYYGDTEREDYKGAFTNRSGGPQKNNYFSHMILLTVWAPGLICVESPFNKDL